MGDNGCLLGESIRKLQSEMKSKVSSKKREREFVISNKIIHAVFDNLPTVVTIKNTKTFKYVYINKVGEGIMGVTKKSIIGKSESEVFTDQNKSKNFEKDRNALKRNVVVDFPIALFETPKGLKYFKKRAIPYSEKSKGATYLIEVYEDMTEFIIPSKKKSSAKIQSLELLEKLKNTRRVNFMNDATAALNGTLDTEDLIEDFASVVVKDIADWCCVDLFDTEGKTIKRQISKHRHFALTTEASAWTELLHSSELNRSTIIDLIANKKPYLYQSSQVTGDTKTYRVTDKNNDSSLTPLSVMIIPLVSYKKIIGLIALISTSKNNIYNELDLLFAVEIAKRVTLAIENANLFTRANESNRTKSSFLANMSHEIRTPLGAMIGFADLALEDGNLSGMQKDYILKVIRNGKQLLNLVDDILDLSKIESDFMHIEKIGFRFSKTIEDIKSIFEIRSKEKGIKFELKFHDSVQDSRLVTDPNRLRQILINVIGNAIKFTEQGTVTVEFNLTTENKRSFLIVDVTDTGIGISENQQKNLFNAFSQLDPSNSRRFGGTGLGLFLSRKLAKLLGGDIVLVTSKEKIGSQFRISIQIELEKESELRKEDLHSEPTVLNSKKISFEGRVLIVDDSEDNLIVLSHYLKNLKIESESVSNGKDAISRALNSKFDLILLDIQMPELDGFEVVQLLRLKHYSAPIVALTAHAMKGDRKKCIEAGFTDYLSKPIAKHELIDMLAQFLKVRETV
jgi:signal transduction histidine kinase/ActR/RegA family two-component response regulator